MLQVCHDTGDLVYTGKSNLTEGDIMPKVSVIIAVYNVEPYLRRCVESVIGQTLKDIEIILVDDGSTDRSGRICDEYRKQDERIRVIHKKNGGYSSALNAGLDAASASYIMFLDPDDWAEPGFCEIPFDAAEESGSDLVVFQLCYVKDGKEQKSYHGETGSVDPETAIKSGGFLKNNKLFKREMFSDVRFPIDRVYEDLAVIHKIVFAAGKIRMLSDFLGNITYRNDSLSHGRIVKNKKDGFLSAFEFAEDMKAFGCKRDSYEAILTAYTMGYLAIVKPDNDPVYRKAEEVLDGVKDIPVGLNKAKKTMLWIWKIDKRVFHFICRVAGLKTDRSAAKGNTGVSGKNHVRTIES